MNILDVNLSISDLFCLDERDFIGSAEPYLWTVFFKIDGDTTSVGPDTRLKGTATVVSTPGNHGNLPDHDVNAGETVRIPSLIGRFSTTLRPIPFEQPIFGRTEAGGVLGAVVILMEEDGTSGGAAAAGHVALNSAVLAALNRFIPTLRFGHEKPTEEEIKALKKEIGDRVTSAIGDQVSVWDWLKVLGDMDDKIGSEYISYSHEELESAGAGGIGFEKRFENEGDWIIRGKVHAKAVGVPIGSLNIVVQGVPSGMVSPVRVVGPGVDSRVGNATLTGLLPGAYKITAPPFTRNRQKPTCTTFTASPMSQVKTVVAGQTVSVSVVYQATPCSDEED